MIQEPWSARLFADEPVIDGAVDGKRPLYFDMYIPDRPLKGLIVYVHGGAWELGSNDRPPGFRSIIRRGFALSSLQYHFSTEVDADRMVLDIVRGIASSRAFLEKRGFKVLPTFLWGISAGGHLVSLTAHRWKEFRLSPDEKGPAAVGSWCGPMDIAALAGLDGVAGEEKETISRILAQLTGSDPETARRISPAAYAGPDSLPHLFVHGELDGLVPVAQSIDMADKLKTAGVRTVCHIIPDEGHAMPPGESPEIELTLDFFEGWTDSPE